MYSLHIFEESSSQWLSSAQAQAQRIVKVGLAEIIQEFDAPVSFQYTTFDVCSRIPLLAEQEFKIPLETFDSAKIASFLPDQSNGIYYSESAGTKPNYIIPGNGTSLINLTLIPKVDPATDLIALSIPADPKILVNGTVKQQNPLVASYIQAFSGSNTFDSIERWWNAYRSLATITLDTNGEPLPATGEFTDWSSAVEIQQFKVEHKFFFGTFDHTPRTQDFYTTFDSSSGAYAYYQVTTGYDRYNYPEFVQESRLEIGPTFSSFIDDSTLIRISRKFDSRGVDTPIEVDCWLEDIMECDTIVFESEVPVAVIEHVWPTPTSIRWIFDIADMGDGVKAFFKILRLYDDGNGNGFEFLNAKNGDISYLTISDPNNNNEQVFAEEIHSTDDAIPIFNGFTFNDYQQYLVSVSLVSGSSNLNYTEYFSYPESS